MIFYLRL